MNKGMKGGNVKVEEGLKFLKSEEVKNINFDLIVKRLELCCDVHNGSCEGCPDKIECIKTFDRKADTGKESVSIKTH